MSRSDVSGHSPLGKELDYEFELRSFPRYRNPEFLVWVV